MSKRSLSWALPLLLSSFVSTIFCVPVIRQMQATPTGGTRPGLEYLWYEAENMRGFSTNALHEPVLNPSWMELARDKAPGWGINGPGVSAEWSQGGESEWNSAAASADETHASIYQDLEVPRAGEYRVWVRYADWVGKTENFTARLLQHGREVFRHEFGAQDVIAAHDETGMYWGWAFVWDGAAATLEKGPARLSLDIEKAAEARRHVDCVLITNDLAFRPEGRRKPDFAAMRALREDAARLTSLAPLLDPSAPPGLPDLWRRPAIAGRDFLMPWNISKEFWANYDRPAAERSLYPFSAESADDFVKNYRGSRSVPIFSSKLVVPVIYLNDLPEYLKEGSAFRRYLRATHTPFAVLINYGAARMSEAEGRAAWAVLNGELREQFLGWVSGESIGHVWADAATDLKRSPDMSRRQLLDALHSFYTRAMEKKWGSIFHTQTGPMWDKLIPAQATSSTSFAHALGEWGSTLLGIETASVQPETAMRIAFTRGAARQYGGAFLYYHAPNFGDTATTFTKEQNFAGPDFFFHTRYGPSMGPSLSWYRKSYYLYYMAGASAIYLEQGFDQFFKPGPGDHPYQLNPLGRITDEFMRFVEKHPDRGTPYTPIAFLLDPAHGWDMTDYPQWPFGVSQINRGDRALRELFGAAYFPSPVREGESATADRQAYVPAIFGDIFDVLVASEKRPSAIDSYRALVAGGRVEWSGEWPRRLADYVCRGGVLLLNSAQARGLPTELLGARLMGSTAEADDARCLINETVRQTGAPTTPEAGLDLHGQLFRYDRIALSNDARVLMETPGGDPLVIEKRTGRGRVIFCAVPDLLGEDERLTPLAAHLLAHLSVEATPVQVSGNVEYLVNRTAHGWLVTLLNDEGVNKPQQGLAQVDREAVVEARVSLDGQGITEAREWTRDRRLEISHAGGRSSLRLKIDPGDLAIVEIVSRP